MVTTTHDETDGLCRYVLRPNHSLTWTSTKLCFAAVAGVSLTIALAFTLMGLWPILPFAGLELLMLGYCFYRCCANAQHCEVITVSANDVRVEKGKRRPETGWRIPRAWAAVALERSPVHWYPSRLLLRSHGRQVELGKFLNEDERRGLARDLRQTLAQTSY